MNTDHHAVHGFTLLETLIAITIVGSVGVLITQVFFTTTRVNTKTELLKEVKQNGQFALDVMSRTMRNATKVNSVCASGGTQLSEIQIINPNGDMTTYGCQYDSSQSVSRIASSSASSGVSDFLTSQGVTLGGVSCVDAAMSLAFVCTTPPDAPAVINITFTLAQKGTPVDQFEKASQRFSTSVTLRN